MSSVRRAARSIVLNSIMGVAGTVAAQSTFAQDPVLQQSARVTLRIASQPMPDALTDFARQTGLQIVASSDTTGGLRTPEVIGTFTPEAALGVLLAESGLRYKFLSERTVAVMSRDAKGAGKPAPHSGIEASGPNPSSSSARHRNPLRLALQNGSGATAQAADDQSGATGADEASAEVAEIIVTAQKIEQNVIDVPISMTVMGEDELAALRVQGIEDYALSIPNVTYQKGARDSGPEIFIRGVSGETGGAFSPISVTVDEIPYNMINSSVLLSMRSFDLAQIEVLRGPQGTLTGANALGGILSLVTVKPDTQAFSAKATVDVGRFDSMFVQGAMNAPLSETFALRTVGYRETSDGATVNIGPSGGSSSTDNFGARVAARWLPSEDWTIDASIAHEGQRYGHNERAYIDRFDDGPNATSERRAYLVGLIGNGGGVYMNNSTPFWGAGADTNGALISLDYPENDDFTYDIASLRAAYDAGNHRFNLIYGYYDFSGDSSWDADRTEMAFFAATVKRKLTSNSLELRASSAYEGRLNWVAGLAWHDESMPYEEVGYTAPAVLVADGFLDPGAVVGNPNSYSLTDYAFVSQSDLTTKAAFASLFYDLTDRLHLSAGVRFTEVEARFGSQCCGDEFASDLAGRNHAQLVAGLDPIVQPDGSSEEINPRVTLNFDVTESSSLYFQYGTGFRPGVGNDPRVVATGVVGQTADPEYVENFEIGFKGRFLDNRASLAAAAFYMDYTDMQVQREAEVPIGGSIEGDIFLAYTTNAGKSTVKGFEVESALQVTRGLELRAAVGYVESIVEEFDDVAYNPGLNTPGVRPWNATFTGIYETPVTDALTAHFRADYRWQDSAWEQLFLDERTPGNYLPSWQTLDLSAGVRADNWAVLGYFENVLDEDYFLGQTNWSTRPSVFFIPRTFGIRYVYTFGK